MLIDCTEPRYWLFLLLATATTILAETTDADPDEQEPAQKELYTSWALLILILLLIVALFTSYVLQTRRIEAVHETVLSIFSGMSHLNRRKVVQDLRRGRNACWTHTSPGSQPLRAWCRELRLPILLQPTPTADHPCIWL